MPCSPLERRSPSATLAIRPAPASLRLRSGAALFPPTAFRQTRAGRCALQPLRTRVSLHRFGEIVPPGNSLLRSASGPAPLRLRFGAAAAGPSGTPLVRCRGPRSGPSQRLLRHLPSESKLSSRQITCIRRAPSAPPPLLLYWRRVDRYLRRLGAEQLLRETGIAEQQLSHYANGQRHPRPDMQRRITTGIQSIARRLTMIL